ncbi:MAG: hypothetical protein WCD70_06205 [Alphaproteobacteria bacterium]
MRAYTHMLALAAALLCGFTCMAAAEEIVPRTIIALYSGDDVQDSYIHTVAEMPLNHLGLTVEFHNIRDPLPDIAARKDVRGVITWFYGDAGLDAASYLTWANAAIEAGKKYVIIGSLGIAEGKQYRDNSLLATRFLDMLGIRMIDRWVEHPLDVTYAYNTPELFLTRAPYGWTHPGYQIVEAEDDKVRLHLAAHRAGTQTEDSALILTSPSGGYMNADYAIRANNHDGSEVTQWMIDPFLFFRLAFATDEVPKPDTTTEDGRRIYYSNIDGDGWNNVTQLEEYRDKHTLSSEVVMEKAVKPYPDLPVMIAPIVGDVDTAWVGSEESRRVTRELWALPWVEAGSHTYSHPFDWSFFKNGDADAEIPFLKLYKYKGPVWKPTDPAAAAKMKAPTLSQGFDVPRAFAVERFDLHKEIAGSIAALQPLLPKGKRIEVLAWSGNCVPWEEAVHLTRVAGVQNINGGDTRFDPDYPAYASVAPIGRQVGQERQIYVSSSNENTYTDLWTENFHAFRYLRKTLDDNETPFRLKPFTIYYHMYSGERAASLSALLSNLDYARTQDVIPIKVSRFTHIAEGFYGARFVAMDRDMWRVENRGTLNTIRFDHGALRAVDFKRSEGVIGQRRFQGSLYVSLDPAAKEPVIALRDDDRYYAQPEDSTPYLIESRWEISSLSRSEQKIGFTAQGYGNGEMIWQVSAPGHYRATLQGKSFDGEAGNDRLLKFSLDGDALEPVQVIVTRVGNAP